MRTPVTLLLVVLLLACPLLCQAAQGDCVDHEGKTEATEDGRHVPLPCPEDGTSCICAGAIHSGDLRHDGLAGPNLLPSFDAFIASLSLFSLSPIHSPGRAGTPLDSLAWGPPQRVHALLQNYRC